LARRFDSQQELSRRLVLTADLPKAIQEQMRAGAHANAAAAIRFEQSPWPAEADRGRSRR